MFAWGVPKLIVECMLPDFLHIVPVLNNAVLNRILDQTNTSLLLGFVSNEELISTVLPHSDHNSLVLRSSDDG